MSDEKEYSAISQSLVCLDSAENKIRKMTMYTRLGIPQNGCPAKKNDKKYR